MAELNPPPQARRSLLGLGAGLLLAFTLSACEVVPRPSTSRAPVETAEEAQPQPPRQETPAPTLPTAETRHRVAVLVPITGTNAGVGTSIANAANLALLDAGGERIRLTVYDTAKGAQAAANQALADGNGLFLGPLLAEDVKTVAPIAWRANVPVVAFSNDVSVAGDGVYLMGFTPGQSVSRVVSYAASQGAERFGALVPEGIYGRRAADAVKQAVDRADGRLVGTETFDRGIAGIKNAVTRLNGKGALDAVLIGDSGRTAAVAAPFLATSGAAPLRILGTELWAADTDLGKTAALRGAWYAAPSDTMFDQLRTRYRSRYGSNPYRLASLGYDAVLLAIRTAGEWRLGRPFPQGELRDRGGFTGVDGAFRFSGDGIAERALEVRQVTATGTVVVSPAPRGFD